MRHGGGRPVLRTFEAGAPASGLLSAEGALFQVPGDPLLPGDDFLVLVVDTVAAGEKLPVGPQGGGREPRFLQVIQAGCVQLLLDCWAGGRRPGGATAQGQQQAGDEDEG